MKVLSLFDGISCGLQALKELSIKVDEYHAFENDKYAIQISQKNHPEIIRHGEINFFTDFTKFKNFDLVIGGSPCQGFSFAGKQLNFSDPRSQLFFEFVRAIKKAKPKYFLLENVKMKKEYLNIISESMGVQPVFINSALVSAQNRQRFYWCNWQVEQPLDKGIYWRDVMQESDNFYYSESGLNWIAQHEKRKNKTLKIYKKDSAEKMQMIEATHYKNYSSQRFFGIKDKNGLRYITPLECERLQTLPDNYTEAQGVSNTQRYKMLGNAWTVEVIKHIFAAKFQPF